MKKFKVLLICISLIILTGCSCSRKEDNNNTGVQPTKISSIYIATGDIGFQSINIDGDGNENDVLTLDSTANILLTISPNSDDYEFVYSNKDIVEIDDNFNIKPLKVGKTTITAKSTDGSNIESNKITIEVVENTDGE